MIEVTDVDEPPVFTQREYSFTVEEERIVDRIGRVTATDPDRAKVAIRWDAAWKRLKDRNVSWPSHRVSHQSAPVLSPCSGTPS